MTQLLENLYTIEVPADATEVHIGKPFGKSRIVYKSPKFYEYRKIELNGEYKLIGEVTADSMTFDPEPYVQAECGGFMGNVKGFHDYCQVGVTMDGLPLETAEQSFRSFLQSNGKHFKNPLGQRPYILDTVDAFGNLKYEGSRGIDRGRFGEDLIAWHEAEEKVIKGKLIFIEKQ